MANYTLLKKNAHEKDNNLFNDNDNLIGLWQ